MQKNRNHSPGKTSGTIKKLLVPALLITGVALIIFSITTLQKNGSSTEKADQAGLQDTSGVSGKIQAKIQQPASDRKPDIIRYGGKNPAPDSGRKTSERKDRYGIKDSVDLIVRADEALSVGDHTVTMKEIIDKVRVSKGLLVEDELSESGKVADLPKREYGIYVVQPGDNIWNIHFKFLRDYFQSKGKSLSVLSDEPESTGKSSGVGRLLKFSEQMVSIYNLQERKVDTDIHILEPMSKIVVYNMNELFSLLDRIEIGSIGRVRFDGESIWIEAEQYKPDKI